MTLETLYNALSGLTTPEPPTLSISIPTESTLALLARWKGSA